MQKTQTQTQSADIPNVAEMSQDLPRGVGSTCDRKNFPIVVERSCISIQERKDTSDGKKEFSKTALGQ
jgi:hypothetical protein